MTRQFAEAKLAQIMNGIKTNYPDADMDTLVQPDEELKAMIAELEAAPGTKDAYAAYAGIIGKDGMKAVLVWKAGANPVGVMTALFMNHGLPIPA